jgi:hypothetical protein
VYEYNDQNSHFTNEELVSESEIDVVISLSSLTRTSSSKVVKFQRIGVINVIDRIFSINAVKICKFFNPLLHKIYVPHFNSIFLKSDILKNAP